MMIDSQIFMYDQLCLWNEIDNLLNDLDKWPDAKEAGLHYIIKKNHDSKFILDHYKTAIMYDHQFPLVGEKGEHTQIVFNKQLFGMMMDSQIIMFDKLCQWEKIDDLLKELDKYEDVKKAGLAYISEKNQDSKFIIDNYEDAIKNNRQVPLINADEKRNQTEKEKKLYNELNMVYTSESWKIGNLLVRPFHYIKKLFNDVLNKE